MSEDETLVLILHNLWTGLSADFEHSKVFPKVVAFKNTLR